MFTQRTPQVRSTCLFPTEKVPEFSTEQGAVFPPRRESTGLLSGSFPAMERKWREALAFFLRKKYRSSLQSKERFSRYGGKVPVFSPAAFRQWKGSGVKHLPFSYGKSTGVLYGARSDSEHVVFAFPATAGKGQSSLAH